MDEVRISRYITPGAFLIGFVLFGLQVSSAEKFGPIIKKVLELQEGGAVILAAVTFAAGFFVMTISESVARMFGEGPECDNDSSRAKMPADAWECLAKKVGYQGAKQMGEFSDTAAQVFHDEVIPEESRKSLIRIWTAHNIARGSAVAVYLSIVVVSVICFAFIELPNLGWVFFSVFIAGILGYSARITWKRHMKQLTFHVRRSDLEKK